MSVLCRSTHVVKRFAQSPTISMRRRLREAAVAVVDHVVVHHDGLLIVEPWFTADAWRTGTVHGSLVVEEPDLNVARLVTSLTRDRFAVTPMHHLVARPSGVTHFIETHELFLATADEYRAAFTSAKLDVTDVLPRGAWIGRATSPRAPTG